MHFHPFRRCVLRKFQESSRPSLLLLPSLGLYVDDFVYFSEDPGVDNLFECLLTGQVKVDFMGLMEWFWVFIFRGVSQNLMWSFI